MPASFKKKLEAPSEMVAVTAWQAVRGREARRRPDPDHAHFPKLWLSGGGGGWWVGYRRGWCGGVAVPG